MKYDFSRCNNFNFRFCVPYNKNTWKLLETTDEYKQN